MDLVALAKQEVKKHVGAIHIKGRLSLLQRKLWNVLLLNAYEKLRGVRKHQIRETHLAQICGYNSHNRAFLRNTLRSLAQTTVEWNILHDGGGDEWGVATLLASAKIRNGLCVYEYSDELSEKLYHPEVYARINLRIQRSFRSSYGLALYENCVRFRNTATRTTGFKPLSVWRDMLGVEDGKYKDFRNLRRRVLDAAVKEVNEYSDILLSVQLQRKGRKVVGVKFDIEDNPQLSLDLDVDPRRPALEVIVEDKETLALPSPVFERVAAFGLEAQASDIISKYDEDRINGNLDIIEAKISRGEKIESIPAIARDAIEKDYRPKKTKIEVDLEGQHIEAKKQQEAARVAREAAERKQVEEEAAKNREIDTEIERLPEDVRARLDEMAARKYGQLMGGKAFEKYRDAKQKGEVPKMNEAVMQSFRRHVFESPEFLEPVQESQS